MNEKFKQFKTRVKNTVKERAPEIAIYGTAMAALATAAVLATRVIQVKIATSENPDLDIVIMESDGEGHAVVSALEALLMMEGNSKTRYKLDDDHYYNFVRSENPTD
ncbi:hypothetical protein D3C84_1062020 [compost metagenome]